MAYVPRVQPLRSDDEIDLREVWRILRRYRGTILTVCSVVVASVTVATLLMRPTYRATALLEIRSEHSFVQLPAVSAPAETRRRDRIETQARILRSESVADAVIRRLDLGNDPELNGSIRQRGFWSGLVALAETLIDPLRSEAPTPEEAAAKLRENLLEQVDVSPVRESNLVEVSFTSFDPEVASRIANTVVEEYVGLGNLRRFESANGAKAFLESEIAKARNQLEHSERALNAFARRENIVDVDGRTNLINVRVEELSSELTRVISERIAAESLLRQVERSQGKLPATLESELVRSLQEKYARHAADYERLQRIYKTGYPKLVQLKAEMDRVKVDIRNERRRLAAVVAMDRGKAAKREALLREELEKEKHELLDLKDRAIQYHILRREWETNRDLHAALLEQLREVGVAAGMKMDGVSIIDRARPPVEPASPRLGTNLAVASVLGLVLGIGLAFLLAHLDELVRTPESLETATGLPVLGCVPWVADSDCEEGAGPERVAETKQWSSAAEALRTVRTNMLLSSGSAGVRVFQVTSVGQGEGKTTSAANLATLLAHSAGRVLLIDADLRRPRMHDIFGIPRKPGLVEALRGDPSIRPCETSVPNLHVLSAGQEVDDPSELLGSPNMKVLLESAGESFDYVIVDSPPILPLTDAALVSTRVGAVVLVASAEATRQDAASKAVKRLQMVGAPLLGVVLNMADAENDETGYYGTYYGGPSDRDVGAPAAMG
jgi:capsular exopolysaccharide synthesis family protein